MPLTRSTTTCLCFMCVWLALKVGLRGVGVYVSRLVFIVLTGHRVGTV